MYYRRKILLALLQQFGGSLKRTDLQKLLFLFSNKQIEPSYFFLPYKYGCFSYQANQDLTTMIKYNQIEDSSSKWQAIDQTNYIEQLTMNDRNELIKLYNSFKTMKGEDLVRFVYENFPYYAINSEIADKILDSTHYQKVLELKPKIDEYTLFTIGYEGKSVEQYVNHLIMEDIKVICDIRKNPISMKYGFSKNQLKNIVENIGIEYQHYPELGINSDKRQSLNTLEDYIALFNDFELNTLPQKSNQINIVYDKFMVSKRIALTCFEADYNKCHRSKVANALANKFDNKYTVKHI